jgi:tetratricopeptide (TPR) repeat protein
MVATTSGELSTATRILQESIELFKSIDDQWSKALALSFLGEIALYENDLDRAMSLCNQSIELARKQGDPWCMMPSLMSFGQMAVLNGDLTNARSNFQEAVDLLRQIGDNWSLSWGLNGLGHVHLMQGELNQAGINFLEALTYRPWIRIRESCLSLRLGRPPLLQSGRRIFQMLNRRILLSWFWQLIYVGLRSHLLLRRVFLLGPTQKCFMKQLSIMCDL